MTQAKPAATTCKKKIVHAIVTTIICDDDSIYLVHAGQLVIFHPGELIEVIETENPIRLRREGEARWITALKLR